jgi:general secretion pathway protein F
MPVFAYRGLTATGDPADGLLDADSPRAAWQTLRGRGIHPTAIAPEAAEGGQRVSTAELADATRRLGSLLDAGLPLTEALAATAESSPATTARALALAAGRVREGTAFADALAHDPHTFAPVYRALVRASEASGTLAAGLGRVADLLDAAVARRRRLVATLTYPLAVAATSLVVLAFLVGWVLPQIRLLMIDAGGRIPWVTRLVLAAGDLAVHLWPVLVAGGLLAAVATWRAARSGAVQRWTGRLATLPIAGPLLRDAATARAAHVLGTLLGAGLPLDRALALAADAAGPVLAPALVAAGQAVRDGEALSHALARTGAVPPLVVRLVATGERSGTVAGALAQAAGLLDADVTRRLDRLTAALEPLLVLATGALVLAVVAALLLPILTLDPTGVR